MSSRLSKLFFQRILLIIPKIQLTSPNMATANSAAIRGREEAVSGPDPTSVHHHDCTTVQSENAASESSGRARDSDISSQSTAPVPEEDASSRAVANAPTRNEHVASENSPTAIDQHTFTANYGYHFTDHVNLQCHSLKTTLTSTSLQSAPTLPTSPTYGTRTLIPDQTRPITTPSQTGPYTASRTGSGLG